MLFASHAGAVDYSSLHSPVTKVIDAVHAVPGAIGGLDSVDLAQRFTDAVLRTENGRVNEMVHVEVTGIPPTKYALFLSREREGDMNYRYVSTRDYSGNVGEGAKVVWDCVLLKARF